ncbi:hypothetical protein GIB67_019458 [Kingdonia uniflora]|uniref:UTP23 sensor motif region domain-containing protein n=1 Tax=Kingdonia uniflora TaxID=39325 RepID=A0A7J7MU23_9MAGN|nr:hypothetical protein GIB67_019458 [Kingdonia uniflora]
MKVKRQKCKRKSLRFYSTCFGFREPFKILCDGTFVHHLISKRESSVNDALSYLLRSTTKVFTTTCCIAELKSLGAAFSQTYEAARNLDVARCGHEKRKSAAGCIEEVIGMKNLEHFFVATQDTELRKKFREIPGVPVINGQTQFLLLEPPSTFQRQFVKSTEQERLHMGALECKMLQKVRKGKVLIQMPKHFSDNGQGSLGDQVVTVQAISSTKATPTFKRKKAKGPNPLSCKKKKIDGKQSRAPNQGTKDAHDTEMKRNRKRKKTHDSTSVGKAT